MTNTKEEKTTVMVTGGGGFIGRAIVTVLARNGHRVVATYRCDPPPKIYGDVHWVRVDVTNASDVGAIIHLHRPSHLMALAWYMGPDNQQSLENFRWLQHSIDLMFAFAEAGGKRVTFCGSCMEYDWSGSDKLREGQTPLNPATEYGGAKAAMFTAFGPMCKALDLSGAWARPFFLYGPGENPNRLAADVIRALLQGQEALCTHGKQKRDFLHVGDVATAMTALMFSDLTGAVNIGSGAAIPLADLIHEIGRQTKAEDLIRLGAREARPGDPPLVEADTTRLHDELGWSPRYTLKTGIADTIAWWRRELARER